MLKADCTAAYNRRVGYRIKLFRELKGLTQMEMATALGYKSTGSLSLIEQGERGLNKTKLSQAATLLDTYPEVLNTESDLTREELIDLDKFLHIRTNTKHPQHKLLMQFIHKLK